MTTQTAAITKPKLAWKSVVVRVARNEAGGEIVKLLSANKVATQLLYCKWDDIFPYWLIATLEDEVVGCIQTVPGKPYGYLDFLYVKPEVSNKVRAIAVKKLLLVGASQLRQLGCEYALGFVENSLKPYKQVLRNNGVVIGPQGNCIVKKLSEG